MGSGIALAIRNRWPGAYMQYKDLHLHRGLVIGETQIVVVTQDNSKYIGNCMTQQYYGRTPNTQYCDYKAIESCLETVKSFCLGREFHSFAMPKIGCGLGGGQWEVVLKIIEKVFESTNLTVVVYDNHAIATKSNRKL